jgi:hypothetical protein
MLKKLFLMAAAVALTAPSFAQATKEEKLKEKGELNKLGEGWTHKYGVGLGFDHSGIVSAKVGSSTNSQIGLKGILAGSSTYRMGRLAWDNVGTLQYGIQQFGTLKQLGTSETDILKPLDLLSVSSKFGYGITEKPVLFYSVLGSFRTQMTPTYGAGYLNGGTGHSQILSGLMSPGLISIAPGIDYKPDEHFSASFSPATLRLLVVADQNIANLYLNADSDVGMNGNLRTTGKDGVGRTVTTQLGASINASYKNNFFADRLAFQTNLNLFSDYLRAAQNIDVEWTTVSKLNIFKGLGLGLNTNLYYDHDVMVLYSEYDETAKVNVTKLSRVPQFMYNFFVTYDHKF